MEKVKKHFKKYTLVYLILLTLPAVAALFVPGYFGASDDLHIAWLYEMHRTLMLGQIPPRFVPDLSYGFGYPLFNFVFPLPFYIGEIFHLSGFSLVDSIKAVFFISFPLSSIFMYLFLRQFTSKIIAFTGALLYVYTPYRFVDLYIRGAIGEILAFAFLPLVGLSFIKLIDSKNLSKYWIGIGSLSLAALILTHNIAAYMFFPAILFLALLRVIFSKEKTRPLINLSSSIILGVLISLYFWLPAIVESSLMKYDTVFNYADHFPTVKQLITPFWGYGASVPGPYDLMSFYLGTVNIFAVLITLVLGFIFYKKLDLNQKIVLGWGGGVFLIVLFMMNYRSSFLWDHLPLLPYFQFPWRFLILTTFIAPIFLIPIDFIKYKTKICLVLIIIIFATNFIELKPHDFLGRTDEYYLNRYIPSPTASEEYRQTQEEYLRLPKATQDRPTSNRPRMEIYGNALDYERIDGLSAIYMSDSSVPFTVNYTKYNFPGWKVTINGQLVPIRSGYPYGQITFDVPAGKQEVRVWFSETPFRLTADIISLLSFIIALVLIVLSFRYNIKRQ